MDTPGGWLPLQGVDATVQKVEPAKLAEGLPDTKTQDASQAKQLHWGSEPQS